MSRLTGFIFVLGVLMIGAASMMAFDAYMNDNRKDAVRAEINTQLDEGAARYEARREDGCRRRCGFFGKIAAMVTDLRDGVFSGVPFDPETGLPQAPEGWAAVPYDLALTEAIVGQKMERTVLVSSTSNKLLMHFDDMAKAAQTGAVRIYRKDGMAIAMAVEISREGLRAETKRKARVPGNAQPSQIVVDGLPFMRHAQVSIDALTDKRTPVAYHTYSMNLDGQVEIKVIALAPDADVQAFLASFDLEPIVARLPHQPFGYSAGKDSISTAQLSPQAD